MTTNDVLKGPCWVWWNSTADKTLHTSRLWFNSPEPHMVPQAPPAVIHEHC